jgi:protocatechuate 3,4-dioxygenase alpha subunit
MKLTPTASQTVGPFFSIGLEHLFGHHAPAHLAGNHPVTIRGTIFDGDLKPIPDAIVEFFEPNRFARVPTSETGEFSFVTDKPDPVCAPNGEWQTPHLNVLIFMRGLLKPVFTRVYFPGEENPANDPVLRLIPPERVSTLFAHPDGTPAHYRWNIVLQGANETVFFEL